MKDSLLVSIITPFYKGNKYMEHFFSSIEKNRKYLKKALQNADIELIIVNDSPSVIVDLQGINVGFEYRIINHKRNLGIHQARVTGLNHCKGEYIIFLDQDDELIENAITNQLKTLIQANADMVICNAYTEKEDGNLYLLYKTKTDFSRLHDLNFYLKSHNVIKSPGQCLIKKECIPIEWTEYIMSQNGSDDLFLWILMLEKSCKFVINEMPLYIHKYTGENLSDSAEKMNVSSLEIVKNLNKIKYVPEQHITILKRARKFSMEFKNKSSIGKCTLAFHNMDLFLYLALNKIKSIIW